jgi:phosphate transport system permease protein
MSAPALLFLILGLGLISYFVARRNAFATSQTAKLRALPSHYGAIAAIWSGLPALILLLGWTILKPAWMHNELLQVLPESIASQSAEQLGLYLNNINLAVNDPSLIDDPIIEAAVNHYHEVEKQSQYLMTALVFVLCFAWQASPLPSARGLPEFTPATRSRKWSRSC